MTTFRTRRSRGGWQVLEPPVVESPVEPAERPRPRSPASPPRSASRSEHAPPAARGRTPRGGQPWKSAPLGHRPPMRPPQPPFVSTLVPTRNEPRLPRVAQVRSPVGAVPDSPGRRRRGAPRPSATASSYNTVLGFLGIDVTGYRCVLVGTDFGRRAEQRHRRGARVGGQTQCTLAS